MVKLNLSNSALAWPTSARVNDYSAATVFEMLFTLLCLICCFMFVAECICSQAIFLYTGVYYSPIWFSWYYSQNYLPFTYRRPYRPFFGFHNSPAMMSAVQSSPSSFDGCSSAQVLSPRNQRSEWQPISENKDVSNKSASYTSNNV